ncbi:ATP-binding protein [Streptomyces sp. NPDC002701]|uniref:ATP-binding protein n=1 Tax=Streptomyces sp. NPDC002701 TaxID=3364661 RepID=UPI00367980FF
MHSVNGGGGPDAPGISTAMRLRGDGSCISAARHLAADFLNRAHADRDVPVSAHALDLTQLVVSELVTNARRHAPGPAQMELRIAGATVEVTVRDSVRARPVVRSADPERIGGHGLEIVRALAESFQVRLEASGKRVTARIALSDTSQAAADPS